MSAPGYIRIKYLILFIFLLSASLFLVRLHAQEFRITSMVRTGDVIRLTYESDTNSYFILFGGRALTNSIAPEDLRLGQQVAGLLVDTVVSTNSTNLFVYKVTRVPLASPLDTDGDGIDDVYELRYPFLNALDASDGTADYDGDGLDNVSEYRTGASITNTDSDADQILDGQDPNPVVAEQIDGTVGPAGGTVGDTAGSGVVLAIPAGMVTQLTQVILVADTGAIARLHVPDYLLPRTVPVYVFFLPDGTPLPAPGVDLTVPLNGAQAGDRLFLYDLINPSNVYNGTSKVVTASDTNGGFVTFTGVRDFSPLLGLAARPSDLFANIDTAQAGKHNPTDLKTDTPAFSAIYRDPAGDTAIGYHIQVSTNASFTSFVWDTAGMVPMAVTTNGHRSPDITYAGATLTNDVAYYYRIRFFDGHTNATLWSESASNTFIVIPPVKDLSISAQDITFSDTRPDVNQSVVITATVHNVGEALLTNIQVRISKFATPLGADKTIASLGPGASTSVTVTTSFDTNGAVLITAFADASNQIAEARESNNQAKRALLVGAGADARIRVSASVNNPACRAGSSVVSGSAVYELLVGGFTQEYPVEGGAVSVDIDGGGSFAGASTTPGGGYQQGFSAPGSDGGYRTFIHVDDGTVEGEEQLWLVVNGVCPTPPSYADLYANSCDSLDVANPFLAQGETTTVRVTVWNRGNTNAVDVDVRLYDLDALVDTRTLPPVPPGSTNAVTFLYTAPNTNDSYRLLRAVVDVKPGELNPYDNEATRVISVGNPTGIARIAVSGVGGGTAYAGNQGSVTYAAYYDVDVDGTRLTNRPVRGGSGSAIIVGSSTNTGSRSDAFGNGSQLFVAPGSGTYSLVVSVTDCGVATGSATGSLTAIAVPPGAGDVFIAPSDIHFEEPYDTFPQVPVGTGVMVSCDFHYAVATQQTVNLYIVDTYVFQSNLVSDVLVSSNCTLSGSGIQVLSFSYPSTSQGAHVIEGVISAGFGDQNNDRASRVLQVGEPSEHFTVNIQQPVNGEYTTIFPQTSRVEVLNQFGQFASPTNLSFLLANFSQVGGYNETFTLVSTGALAGATYANNEYEFVWDPPNTLGGVVRLGVVAQGFAGGGGSDTNVFNVIPNPFDLFVSAADIRFSTNHAALNQAVGITAAVHNASAEALSNVLVRFLANGVALGSDRVISNLAAGGSAEVSLSTSFASNGARVIQVIVDPANTLQESDEDNNTASRAIAVGAGIGARIVVSASLPRPVCGGSSATLSGQAAYEIVTGPLTNYYDVEGAITTFRFETGTVYAAGHTDVDGRFQQPVGAPQQDGFYRLYITVDDTSIQGQEEIALLVDNSACTPVSHPELEARACSGFALDTNVLAVGATTTVRVTVWNTGSANASNVVVELRDIGRTNILSTTLPLVAAGGSNVAQFIYVAPAPADTYRVLHAVVQPLTNESTVVNNEATHLIAVGSPTDAVQVAVTGLSSVPDPAFVNQSAFAQGAANYLVKIGGVSTSVPVRGASVSVTVNSGTTPGGRSDAYGHAVAGFTAPAATGVYAMVLSVDDCSLAPAGSGTGSVTVVAVPDNAWVNSEDIHFEDPFDAAPQVPTNLPIEISVALHYAVSSTRTNIPVLVRDLHVAGGVLVTNVLYSNRLTFAGAGAEVIGLGYTGTVRGAHVIEADIESNFGNLSDDQATRALQVGPPDNLLVVNIERPVNGEVITPDPYMVCVKIRDEFGVAQTPADLGTLVFDFERTPVDRESIDVVRNGEVTNGAWYSGSGEFCILWDPRDSWSGPVTVRATAQDYTGGDGADANVITLIPRPVDLSIRTADLAFSTTNPAVGQTFSITARVHNAGTQVQTNVAVAFYANDAQIGATQVVPLLAGGTSATVSVATSFTNAQLVVIRATADPDDAIVETDEDNNSATRFLVIGSPGIGGRLIVRTQGLGPQCPDSILAIAGNAYYEIPFGIATNTYRVEGGAVSVEIATGTVFASSHTDINGQFAQQITVPGAQGAYTLYVRVTDESLEGQEEVALSVSTGACAAAVQYVDLELRACAGMQVTPSTLAVGATSTVQVTVWNSGNLAATGVDVLLYDLDAVVNTGHIAALAAGTTQTVSMAYQAPAPDNTYRVLRAVAVPVPGELNPYNNEATHAIRVGTPVTPITITVSNLYVTSPLHVGEQGTARGQASYVFVVAGTATNLPVAAANVSVDVGGNPFGGSRTDPFGNAVQGVTAPALTGAYPVVMTVDDCSGYVEFSSPTGTLQVILPPEDVWVYSQDIHFQDEIDQTAQVPTNQSFGITVFLHHSLNGTTNLPVVINDRYTDAASNLIVKVLYSNAVTFAGSGIVSLNIGNTSVVAGLHIIEADIKAPPGLGDPSNDKDTRALQVGPPAELLVVNIFRPANGEVISSDPYIVNIRVLDQAIAVQSNQNLALLVLHVERTYWDFRDIVLVDHGALTNGAVFSGGRFYASWDPPDSWHGEVSVRATAVGLSGAGGVDENVVTIQQRPADLEITTADISFSTNQPAVSQSVVITSVVHNVGTLALTNVEVQFYANDSAIGSPQVIPVLGAGSSAVVSVTTSFGTTGARVIRVLADPSNVIPETDEGNNAATRILVVGNLFVDAEMLVTANFNSPQCPGGYFYVSGSAVYHVLTGGQTNTYPVEGCAVTVQVAGAVSYAGALTDVQGSFQQLVAAPLNEGIHLVATRVSDSTLIGTNQALVAVDSDACSAPGSGAPDLYLQSCGGLSMSTNALSLGSTATVSAVVWNNGSAGATEVVVDFYDGATLVTSRTIQAIQSGGNATATVDLVAAVPDASYHLLRVAARPAAGEINAADNEATRLFKVGSATGTARIVVTDVNVQSPRYTSQGGLVSARALYDVPGLATGLTVRGGALYVQVTNAVAGGAHTDANGYGVQGFTSPAETGNFDVVVYADDCSGLAQVSASTGTVSVLPPPQDIWTSNGDIHFQGEIDGHPQVATGAVFNIFIGLNYAVNGVTSAPVRVTDTYMICSNGLFVTNFLFNSSVTFTDAGVNILTVPYTGAVEAAHIFNVRIDDSAFGNTNNNIGTRVLQVGQPGTNLSISIVQPVNGQDVLTVPTQVLFTVYNGASPVSPTNMSLLVVNFTPVIGAQETVVLVNNRVLVAGLYTNSAYSLTWDPPDNQLGQVTIHISALLPDCGSGSTTSVVTVVTQVDTNPVRNLSTGVRYSRLEDAMAQVQPNQSIALRQGVHLLTGTVSLVSGIQVRGGYDSGWNRVGGSETTVVSGQGLVRCFYGSQLAVAAELGYMTIRDGYAGAGYDADGGALKLEVQARAYVHDCAFVGSTSAAFQAWAGELFGGGAVSVRFSDPTFARCTFASNTVIGGEGGAMRLHYAAPAISSCVFSANSAVGGDGGAIYATFSSPRIIDTVFDSNQAVGGGAVTLRGGVSGLRNDAFVGNGAGALSIENAAVAGGTNLSFASSSLHIESDSAFVLVNGIVFANGTNVPVLAESGAAVAVTYSAIEGGYSGTGNIASDPAWVNAAAGDVHVATNSPCANSGSASAAAIGLDGGSGYGTNPDGVTGDAGAVDMGYHYGGYGP